MVGACVTIPFGNGNRIMKGYIIGLSYEPKFFVSKIKCIQKIEERELTTSEQLLQLAVWMKERYGCTMNEAIKTVMPMKRTVKIKEDRTLQLAISLDKAKAFLAELEKKANTGARVRLLKECICQGTVQVREVKKKLNLQESTIQSLINNGIIRSATSRVYRNPIGGGIGRIAPIQLNHDQQMIVDAINQNISLSVMKNYLIHGITGSGKTEVYMAIMERVIHEGKQVILLIPEIALTFQTVQRFYGRFGDRVSILNSRLSEGERFDQDRKSVV